MLRVMRCMSIPDVMFLGYMQVNSLRLFLSLHAQCVLLMYCHNEGEGRLYAQLFRD